MRKFCLLVFCFFQSYLFGFDFPIEENLILHGFNGSFDIEKHDKQICFSRQDGPDYKISYSNSVFHETVYEMLNLDNVKVGDDGWFRTSLFSSNQLIIFGGDYFLFHDLKQKLYSCFVESSTFYENTEIEKDDIVYFCGDRKKIISTIIFPDILTEKINGKNIEYNSFDMEHYFCRLFDEVVYFNRNAIPWATSQNPIGMIIEMKFYNQNNKITILNGYVNPEKPYLYKANRRLKRIRIYSDVLGKEFSLVVDFSDSVHFQEIKLPESVKNLKIEILDFYEGEKYKDLCVQMIGVPMGLNWYDYDVQRDIRNYGKYIPFKDIENEEMIKYSSQILSPEKTVYIK